MFTRGVEKRHGTVQETALGVFRCSQCHAPLELERVVSAVAERKGAAVTGWVVFQHWCACADDATRTSRSWGTHKAFCALFGTQPWLPYRAPFGYRPVAEDDPSAIRWRWELDHTGDIDEFLLFLDDARARARAARQSGE